MNGTIKRQENGPILEEDSQKGKYLTFHLGAVEYGVEICYVTEIIGIQQITAVPDMDAFIKGVINLPAWQGDPDHGRPDPVPAPGQRIR